MDIAYNNLNSFLVFEGSLNFIFCRFNNINLLLFINTMFILLARLSIMVEIRIKFINVLTFTYLGTIIINFKQCRICVSFLFIGPYFFRTLLFICIGIVVRTTK